MELHELAAQLSAHEQRSQARYEALCKAVQSAKESQMSEGINTDKVIVNAGGGGDNSGLNAAVTMAALGNRNEKDVSPLIMAALGNRNENRRGYDDGGFGFGGSGGVLGLVALLGLLRGRGGLGGDDDCCDNGGHGRTAILQTLMESQADLRAAVPQAVAELQNQLCQQFGSLALGTQQGLSNVKDAVQALALFQTGQLNAINQNVSDQGCRTRDTVQSTSTAILQALAENKYEALKNELLDLRHRHHAGEAEFRITQTVNQNQAQAQQQQQQQRFEDERFNRLWGSFIAIANQTQRVRSEQDIVNLGTMTASGTQAQANTQVR